jgi:outer membrane protein
MKRVHPLLLSVLLSGVGLPSYADSLLQVYQLAQQNNPELRSAAAKQVEAAAGVSQARGALLPQLGLNADYRRFRKEQRTPEQTLPDPYAAYLQPYAQAVGLPGLPPRTVGGYSKNYGNQSSVDLTLTQSLVEVPKWHQLSAAQQRVQLQEINYQAAQQKLMLETATGYFKSLLAIDTLKHLTSEKKATERKLHEIQQQSNVGVIPIKELYKAKSEYDLAVAAELRQQHQVESALEELRELSGHYHKQLKGLESSDFNPKLPSGAIESWLQQSEQHNWGLLSARLEQRIALQRVRGAQANHLPTIQLVAKAQHSRTATNTIDKAQEVSGGLSLSLPLFSGGQIAAKVKAEQSGVVQASEALERCQREVIRRTHEAYNGLHAALRTSRAYQQAIISSQRELDAMEACFKVGTVTFIEVIEARTKLLEAKQRFSGARYDYFKHLLSLKAAVGQLSEEDLQAVDQIFNVTIPTSSSPTEMTPETGNVASNPQVLGESPIS